ncbi:MULTISPECIES: PAM68 family protein [Arthrospira]|jgi:hypothetical protein|uniref:DUF3464 family protein n=1 Tax=Limnospira platensis NIES-46 TaxID=1236695 RepID=A0A5M3TG15_LIMPL|nr:MULTISPECIES: PAM68 family protein [Arthrospira]AMW29109.1 hypothetical protein AP285_15210 [Arthrospira platensis YZ]KDR55100.1 hypothetical protein APPUASWS_025175 [Arthrospira platensis str. Paraca]MBD2671494.1 PAM68 family protein [Arthrospira platensis FACHB-439]MBD2712428.1 PAM68 family protein [Arthrospira platensis FACHB-835]MDF2212956.1 PAM68 family protein [Arthrospira platensis NCB002]MDT9184958.1 PAM68 family protein [Limnospira sp. PMC 289.06]MDT9297184.1 PAM68 family protein
MSSDRSRQPLPFEPKKTRKKQADSGKSAPSEQGKPEKSVSPKVAKTPKNSRTSDTSAPRRQPRREDMTIPEVVSQRMVSRMVFLSGIPLLMAISTFVGSYFIVTNEIFPLPNTAVLLVSLGCFGLSVVGLSYGVLSASWDEDLSGSFLGWQEFKINLGRAIEAWKEGRQQSSPKN